MNITLDSPLTLKNALLYPLQSPASRRDALIGALWLLVPVVGWLMNMGHRIVATNRALRGENPWPAWGTSGIFRHGLVTFAGMVVYHAPSTVCFILADWTQSPALYVIAILLWLAGTCVVPGYMTRYCVDFDAKQVFNVARSVRAVLRAGPAYFHAWAIVLVLLAASFLGLFLLGVGFLFTSVCFWQSAAFCFANVMKRRLDAFETHGSLIVADKAGTIAPRT